jgi:hypothetical protein
LASDFSDRLTFEPSNKVLCDDIRACLRDQINRIQPQDATDYKIEQFEPYDFCNEDDLEVVKAQICGVGISVNVTKKVPPVGGPGCKALPTCPALLKPYFTDFGPAYPPDSGPYADVQRSITGTGLAIENGFGKLRCVELR